jgi:hypothetical protein
MKKLQAALKDSAWRGYKMKKMCYKVGSVFKGCHNCGEFEYIGESDRKKYSSGFMVFRSYHPAGTKWTYWCWECGAKDQQAWENAEDIGQDAIRGTRDAVKKAKYRLRKERAEVVPVEVELAQLEGQIRALMAKIEEEAR